MVVIERRSEGKAADRDRSRHAAGGGYRNGGLRSNLLCWSKTQMGKYCSYTFRFVVEANVSEFRVA